MKTFIRLLPALVIMGVSCYLSSLPTIEMMPSFWNADKLVHLICFGGLTFWVAFGTSGLVSSKSWSSRLWLWLVPVIVVAVYGCLDEFHQSFTPGRSCSVLDWLADVAGAALGSFVHLTVVSSRCGFSAWWRHLAGVADKQ